MQKQYDELFLLMDHIGKELEKLTELAQKKNAAAINDDITAINEIINREQAESLAFRGFENKRTELLKRLDLENVALSALAQQCPPEVKQRAEESVRKLQNQYEVYRGCAEVARRRMEENMHEIEHVLTSLGAQEKTEGPGYHSQKDEMPSNMKTDFHA